MQEGGAQRLSWKPGKGRDKQYTRRMQPGQPTDGCGRKMAGAGSAQTAVSARNKRKLSPRACVGIVGEAWKACLASQQRE